MGEETDEHTTEGESFGKHTYQPRLAVEGQACVKPVCLWVGVDIAFFLLPF